MVLQCLLQIHELLHQLLFRQCLVFFIFFFLSKSFKCFGIRSIWKIWDLALFCWKWFYNACYKSMNFFIYSFLSNIGFFFILFFLSKCFECFGIGSIWKIWDLALFCWKWFYNACYKSMNFFIYSFFANVWFFFYLIYSQLKL